MGDNLILHRQPEDHTKCSFCLQPLAVGKFVRSGDSGPSICFSCVKELKKTLDDAYVRDKLQEALDED